MYFPLNFTFFMYPAACEHSFLWQGKGGSGEFEPPEQTNFYFQCTKEKRKSYSEQNSCNDCLPIIQSPYCVKCLLLVIQPATSVAQCKGMTHKKNLNSNFCTGVYSIYLKETICFRSAGISHYQLHISPHLQGQFGWPHIAPFLYRYLSN